VDPSAIRKTALLTLEGERDDISAPGQTIAAHRLCAGLPPEKHYHFLQGSVGHYGIFNGRRWRTSIMPRVRALIRAQGSRYTAAPSMRESVGEDLAPVPLEDLARFGYPVAA